MNEKEEMIVREEKQPEKYDEIISNLQQEFIEQDNIMKKWGENQEKEQNMLMKQLSVIERENKQLQEHLNKINQNKKQMEELNVFLAQEIEQKEQFMLQINEYEHQISAYAETLEKTNVQIEDLTKENEELKRSLKSEKRDKKRSIGKYVRKKEELSVVETDYLQIKEYTESLETEKQALIKEMNVKVEEFLSLENKVKELEKLNNKMLSLFEEDQKKNEQLIQAKVDELVTSEQKVRELEKKNKELMMIIENERKEKTRIINSLETKSNEENPMTKPLPAVNKPTDPIDIIQRSNTEYDSLTPDKKEPKVAKRVEDVPKKDTSEMENPPKKSAPVEKKKDKKEETLDKESKEVIDLFLACDHAEAVDVKMPVDKYTGYRLSLKFLEYRWYQANIMQMNSNGKSELAWSEIYVSESGEFFEELENLVKVPLISKKYVIMDKEVKMRLKAYQALADYLERHYF